MDVDEMVALARRDGVRTVTIHVDADDAIFRLESKSGDVRASRGTVATRAFRICLERMRLPAPEEGDATAPDTA